MNKAQLIDAIASGSNMTKTDASKVLGAVTGAIMVLGILEGEKAADNSELKSSSYEAVKEFFVRFTDEYQTTNCKDLTSCDFGTDAGSLKFKNEGVMEKICVPCVMRAVKIVEEIT